MHNKPASIARTERLAQSLLVAACLAVAIALPAFAPLAISAAVLVIATA
jgi:hypothetical protein